MDSTSIRAEIRVILARRVDTGVEWLNDDAPGWLDKMNLDTLALDNIKNCVAGQVYGHYGTFNFKEGSPEGHSVGFSLSIQNVLNDMPYMPEGSEDYNAAYRMLYHEGWPLLQAVWVDKIKELQAAA